MLQKAGLKPGELTEEWNITHSDKIVSFHKSYLAAGADIIKTNTFGANILKFPLHLEKTIKAAIENAIKATGEAGHGSIALDIGPTGKLLKPMGDLDFEDAVRIFKKTILTGITLPLDEARHTAGKSSPVDIVLIETMNDIYEAKAAVIAAKEAMEEAGAAFPIYVTTVYDEGGHSLTGSTPEVMAAVLEGLGVSALGMNCSTGPSAMIPLVKRLKNATSLPIIVNPNAGLPRNSGNGETVYDVNADEFAAIMKEIAEAGASILGGCCGTTPEYIRNTVECTRPLSRKALCAKGESLFAGRAKENCKDNLSLTAAANNKSAHAVIASAAKTVVIGGALPVLIGERINPTGKKRFKEALRAGDMPYIVSQALEQESAGAMVLDVNAGLPEIDEKEMMVRAVCEIQAVCPLPLEIDTSSPAVMEAALRRYNGKALINSVNGKTATMEAVLPLVQKYGGVVAALTIDEGGIPQTAEGRVEIAHKIEQKAASYGIKKSDILIDPLAMAVSADGAAALETLRAIRMLSREGFHTILGVSNVSFGLPERETVTSAFFTMALDAGLSAAIMNPISLRMMEAYHCYCLLTGQDENAAKYINWCGMHPAAKNALKTASSMAANAQSAASENTSQQDADCALDEAIIKGLKALAAESTDSLLKGGNAPLDVIDKHIIPALDTVGKRFEAKTLYLPQLLMSAEAASSAFDVIKKSISSNTAASKDAGSYRKVIIATVKGDIHDIGKNIVKVLLENYGFTVIDLGKDVAPEVIAERAALEHIMLVGLSALMTTTVPSMEETISLLHKKAPWAKVCAGGAVMTAEYAKMIGADFYAKDAMATVRYAKEVLDEGK